MAVPIRALLAFIFLFQMIALVLSHGKQNNDKKSVTYDGRSLMVGGKRDIFFSGSIHYPRSTPDMWPAIIKKAKHGGLNTISTYVFWNIHEPTPGQFNFEGNNDLVKFIKLIGKHGMYAILRIGPFIEAEWNHGGFPFWLREVPNITFRCDNEPFKFHMKRYSEMIIKKVKDADLFFPQGGPIILAQIENEYNNIQLAFKENGDEYVQWAGNMALGLNVGVPWIMCKQRDAPGAVINTCNGRHCGDTFTGPNRPDKPALWTENWTAQYRVFGDPPSQRAAEDLAYAVARFFSKKGTLTNYYMYHGGTNFGRTSSTFVTPRYYDEAPIDEFGMIRGPKWGHLKDLHSALRLSRKALLWGTHSFQSLGIDLEALFFEKSETNICAAFLTNTNSKIPATVSFRGTKYYLPARSISILPDCKTVVFNTQTVVAQHNTRTFVTSNKASKNLKWEMFQESIPTTNEVPISSPGPLELYGLNRDVSDYAWYTTSLRLHSRDLPWRHDIKPVLRIASLGHALLAFVNGEFVGTGHGSNIEKSFLFQKAINLKSGVNHIAILAMTVGLPNSGVYMEKRYAGPRDISILGLNTGTLDLTVNGWGHKVGLIGEKLGIFTEKGSHNVDWRSGGIGAALTWYKTRFDAPGGSNPVAMVLSNFTKGMAWVNGKSIGRYWDSYLSPLESPTQTEYHVPRSFLKDENNLLVVLEESGGSPEGVEFVTANRDRICSLITEHHPPHVGSWERKNSQIRAVVDAKSSAMLQCSDGKVVIAVEFASFGDPYGVCGALVHGSCNSHDPKSVVEKFCMGKNECSIPIERDVFNAGDVCPNIAMTLAVQVRCGFEKNRNHAN